MGKADVFQFVNGCGKCIACGKAAIHAVDKSLMQHALTDQFVRVIVQAPLGPLDYRVDESTEVAVGDRVLVTLGARQVVGIVVEVTAFSAVEGRKLKKVLRVLGETEPFRREWLELMRFTANYYIRSWGEAALSSLPRFFRLPPRARRQASLNRIREIPPMSIESRPIPTLNAEQQAASRAVSDSSGFSPFVLFGVTGSGKTEVYLQIMHEVLEKNPENQVLLLVPEINLTPQLEARVRERFPEETVVTLHSALSDGDRARNWLAVHEGRARILVGTRLAIFASFRRLALILVDEEHDESYKADDGARFSARDLAIKRAQMNAVACVLGSATPSLETWEKVRKGVYRLLRLSHRAVKEAELPNIAVVDRRADAVRSLFPKSGKLLTRPSGKVGKSSFLSIVAGMLRRSRVRLADGSVVAFIVRALRFSIKKRGVLYAIIARQVIRFPSVVRRVGIRAWKPSAREPKKSKRPSKRFGLRLGYFGLTATACARKIRRKRRFRTSMPVGPISWSARK